MKARIFSLLLLCKTKKLKINIAYYSDKRKKEINQKLNEINH